MSEKELYDSIPYYTHLFQPVLDALKELGGSGRPAEVRDRLISRFDITDAMLGLTTKGGESLFSNRMHWARYYLLRSGYLDSSQRGVWNLTEAGRDAVITSELAQEIERQVKREAARARAEREPREKEERAPDDTLALFPDQDHRASLARILRELPPAGFERLCQRLLRESGFEQVTVTGKSGDGGIDGYGVLQVNPFVSFRVLFQCKRHKSPVGSPFVRDFRGAMAGRADKGIVITTSTFTPDARKEAVRDGVPPIELVDGDRLLDLFESLELGLKPKSAFEIDESFFEDFA